MNEKDLLQRIFALEEALAARDVVIARLMAENEELRRRLGLHSRNSSKPPSTDGLRKKASPQSLRKKGVRKSGGQAGHEGVTLKQSAHPDEKCYHRVFSCPCCQGDLEAAPVRSHKKRQVFDIPIPAPLVVTEHCAEVKYCANCGKEVSAEFPSSVTAPVQYGERIQTYVSYLHDAHFIPEDRLQELMKELFGVGISTATLMKMVSDCAKKAKPLVEKIIVSLKNAPVKHLDETGFRVGGKTCWLHIMSNTEATAYHVSPKRGDIWRELSGIVVHDHFKPYYTLENVQHALCNAHHLRELEALKEAKESWAFAMSNLLYLVARLLKKGDPPESQLNRIFHLYDRIVERGLQFHEANPLLSPKPKPGRQKRRDGHNLLIRLKNFKDDVLRCLNNPIVPFTNNNAEQAVRMMKVKQKISGGFRSNQGAHNFAATRSLIATARKQGINPINAIQSIFNNNPLLFQFA